MSDPQEPWDHESRGQGKMSKIVETLIAVLVTGAIILVVGVGLLLGLCSLST